MKMNPRRSGGFALILVIAVIAQIGLALSLLTIASRDLGRQARNACAEASRANLQASALAWAGRYADEPNSALPQGPVDLSTATLAPKSKLSVLLTPSAPEELHLQITSSYPVGGRIRKYREVYVLPVNIRP